MTGRVGRSSFYCFDTVRQTDAKILAGRSIGTTMATTTTMTTTPRTTTTTTLMTTINHIKVNVLSPRLHVNVNSSARDMREQDGAIKLEVCRTNRFHDKDDGLDNDTGSLTDYFRQQ